MSEQSDRPVASFMRPTPENPAHRLSRRQGRILLILTGVAYVTSLHLVYRLLVVNMFGYAGYTYASPGVGWLSFAFALALLPMLWLPLALRRPSQAIIWFLYLLVYVPAMLVPRYIFSGDSQFRILVWNVALSLSFSSLHFVSRLPLLRLPGRGLSGPAFWTFLAFLSAILYLTVIATFGFHLAPSALNDVYDTRADFKAASSGVTNYAVIWIGNVVNAALVGMGIVKRKLLLLAAGLVGQLFLYSITGFKTLLFSPFLLGLLVVATRSRGRHFGLWMSAGATLTVIVASLVSLLTGSSLAVSLFVRRLILVPGLLTGYYADFFSSNPPAHLSNSILHGLVRSPYDVPIPFLIGRIYFRSPDTSANGNVFADGIANFGVPGLFLWGFLLIILLWGIDSATRRSDIRLTVVILGLPAFALTNSALFTTLLTHGLALGVALVVMMPRSSWLIPRSPTADDSPRPTVPRTRKSRGRHRGHIELDAARMVSEGSSR